MGPRPKTDPILLAFGRRVRQLRQDRGWSQERLAEEAGIHTTYVSGIERGRRNVALINIVRLAGAFAIDPGELVAGVGRRAALRGRRHGN